MSRDLYKNEPGIICKCNLISLDIYIVNGHCTVTFDHVVSIGVNNNKLLHQQLTKVEFEYTL